MTPFSTLRAAAALAAIAALAPVAAGAKDLLIRNVSVISGDRAALLAGANVLVRDGRIATLAAPRDARAHETIDGTGKFLIPGLIDSHVHLYHATGLKRQYTDEFDRIYEGYLDQQPRSFLYYGYTSVIELNASPSANDKFRGADHHPALYQCGHGLVLDNGFMALEFEPQAFVARFPHFLHDPHGGSSLPAGIDPADHAPQVVVRRLKEAGAACIKLYYEEALWMPGGPPPFALPSAEIVRDVVAAAHAEGMPVLLHATTPAGHRFALETGIDILAHGLWEWPGVSYAVETPPAEIQALADAVAAADIAVQPTLRTIRNTQSLFDDGVLADPRLAAVLTQEHIAYLRGPAQAQRARFLGIFGALIVAGADPAAVSAHLRSFTRRYERLIGDMAADGATLLLGSDTAVGGFGWGNPPGLNGFLEMQGWRAGGVPLRMIFAAATSRNADAFGLGDEIGRVAPGLRADLLLLDANPLETLDAYDRIDTVILRGEAIPRERLSARARP